MAGSAIKAARFARLFLINRPTPDTHLLPLHKKPGGSYASFWVERSPGALNSYCKPNRESLNRASSHRAERWRSFDSAVSSPCELELAVVASAVSGAETDV